MKALIAWFIALFIPVNTVSTPILQTPTPEPAKQFTLVSTGDVLTARSINARSVELNDYIWPWNNTVDLLKDADLTFINLETPLVDDCPIRMSGTVFCGNPRHIEGLKYADIDVINLANNHIGNHGDKGILETQNILSEFHTTGINNPTIVEVNDLKVAFLGFNLIFPETPGGTWAYSKTVETQIREARLNADFVIAAFHWGTEYTIDLTDDQVSLAHLAVDSGADAVIGHHPHWVQPQETYKGKPILYSHGNFIFDQFWSEKTREGIVSKITFTKGVDPVVEITPIYIDSFGAPVQKRLPTQVTSDSFNSGE
jgi:gamma-polyglutamate biosynthesis protein CapA